MSEATTPTLDEDLHALEVEIARIRERAQWARHRVMRELENAHPNPSLCLMEQSVRALGSAADAARYARHNLKLTGLVHDGTVTLAQTGFASEE